MQVDRSTGHLSFSLNRGKEAPALYIQVAHELERRLLDATYPQGGMLPSEPLLAAELGVSRATIIKAFDVLAAQGMIERRQGRGTFALRPPARNSLTEVISFSAITRLSGASPSHRLIGCEVLGPQCARVGPAGAFAASEPLVRLERVRFSDEVAVGHHVVVVPKRLWDQAELTCEGVSEPSFSLYAALDAIGQSPDSADEALQAVGCPSYVTEHLGITENEPMMRVHRLTRNRLGHLIEAVDAHYLGSLYEYQSRRTSTVFGGAERAQHAKSEARGHGSSRDISIVDGERLRRAGA